MKNSISHPPLLYKWEKSSCKTTSTYNGNLRVLVQLGTIKTPGAFFSLIYNSAPLCLDFFTLESHKLFENGKMVLTATATTQVELKGNIPNSDIHRYLSLTYLTNCWLFAMYFFAYRF